LFGLYDSWDKIIRCFLFASFLSCNSFKVQIPRKVFIRHKDGLDRNFRGLWFFLNFFYFRFFWFSLWCNLRFLFNFRLLSLLFISFLLILFLRRFFLTLSFFIGLSLSLNDFLNLTFLNLGTWLLYFGFLFSLLLFYRFLKHNLLCIAPSRSGKGHVEALDEGSGALLLQWRLILWLCIRRRLLLSTVCEFTILNVLHRVAFFFIVMVVASSIASSSGI
jgi:hypothetical protein